MKNAILKITDIPHTQPQLALLSTTDPREIVVIQSVGEKLNLSYCLKPKRVRPSTNRIFMCLSSAQLDDYGLSVSRVSVSGHLVGLQIQ